MTMRVGARRVLLNSGRDLVREINVWQNASDRVHIGGLAAASFAATASLSGGTTAEGRTYICGHVAERIWQDGFVRQVVVSVNDCAAANGWQFKVFRPNGSNFDYVGSSEAFTMPGTGTRTITLTTPIPCQPGDIPGVWIGGQRPERVNVKAATGYSAKWVAGNETGSNVNFTNNVADFRLDLDFLTNPPYLVGTGDSIAEGHNTYHSYWGGGPDGAAEHEIWNQLRGKIGNGTELQYQNHALGGQTFAWVLSTGIVAALAALPRVVVIHCGVNDVATGRTWDAVLADLDAIRALVTTQRLLVDEILPWTAGSDEQAATVRAWNANLAAWCATNSATLVRCHDAMGQVRVATGQLDDLVTTYNADGVHLTDAGVDAMAAIIKEYL